jgi:hypothetical protein
MNTKHFRIATFSIPAFLLVLLSGCLKTHEGFVDFTQTTDFVILTGAGTGNFKASNILVNTASTDTVKKTIIVNLASKDNNNGEVAVTVGVDAAAITAYNAANGTKYQPFPAGSYKLTSKRSGWPALWINYARNLSKQIRSHC